MPGRYPSGLAGGRATRLHAEPSGAEQAGNQRENPAGQCEQVAPARAVAVDEPARDRRPRGQTEADRGGQQQQCLYN